MARYSDMLRLVGDDTAAIRQLRNQHGCVEMHPPRMRLLSSVPDGAMENYFAAGLDEF